jgi:hypothetical protein
MYSYLPNEGYGPGLAQLRQHAVLRVILTQLRQCFFGVLQLAACFLVCWSS